MHDKREFESNTSKNKYKYKLQSQNNFIPQAS